jgi:response regulator of citrate/malate metabolism
MKKEKKIVIIADDSELSVESILFLHRKFDHIQIVSYAGSWKETLTFVEGIGPDMILQGIRLPDKSGIALLGKMMEANDVIIVLTATENNPRNHYGLSKKQGYPTGFSERFVV